MASTRGQLSPAQVGGEKAERGLDCLCALRASDEAWVAQLVTDSSNEDPLIRNAAIDQLALTDGLVLTDLPASPSAPTTTAASEIPTERPKKSSCSGSAGVSLASSTQPVPVSRKTYAAPDSAAA